MNIVKTIAAFSLAVALQTGAVVGAAGLFAPSKAEAGSQIKPGPKPGNGAKRPQPIYRPCHPNPQMCRGGGI